jgi:predicted Zn-dependent protease
MKTLTKIFFVILFFLGLWFGLSQIDFVKYFGIQNMSSKTEKTIGDLIWKEIERTEHVIYDYDITETLDSLILPLCKKNGIDRNSLKIHIVRKDEVNAFAFPDRRLVVYSGLILECKNEEALLGILGHEIAHIEKNHVMKKLSKEIGLATLLTATGANSQIVMEIFRTISSSAYDRSLEREADIQSVKYLLKAEIDPMPFADFMYELSLDNDFHKYTYWISTHPESEERSQYIKNFLKSKNIKSKEILSDNSWKNFKQNIRDYDY